MLIKRAISFLLVAIMVVIMVQPSVKIISFYQNQAEIIAEHCVNKDKPALKCEGHCYLDQQLKQDKDQPENNAIPEVNVFIPMAVNCVFSIILPEPIYISNKAFYRHILDDEIPYSGEIFTPPKIIA